MRRAVIFLLAACLIPTLAFAQQSNQNVPVLPVLQPAGTDSASVLDAALKGDLYMQRQLEPSIAVSTRNPSHILTFFNDYRAVEIPSDVGIGQKLARAVLAPPRWFASLLLGHPVRPGLPTAAAASDAWIGMSRSYDGGLTWSGGMLPGSPPDPSPASLAAPVYGLKAAADPAAHAAPCGMIHLVFLAFTRGGASKMVVATFEDTNDSETADTFHYRGMTVLETANNAVNGYFVDKPSIAIDPARTGSDPCGYNIYVSYSVFNGLESDGRFRTKVMFARSTDKGQTFTDAKVNMPFNHNQGTALAVDPRPGTPSNGGGGTVYLAWRHFWDPDTVLVMQSPDFGGTWPGQPVSVLAGSQFPSIQTFDQPTMASSSYPPSQLAFRSNGYPTIAVAGNGNVFLAWQERVGRDPNSSSFRKPLAGGSPRIVLTVSPPGAATWSERQPVDMADRDTPPPTLTAADLGLLPQPRASGPQVMPRLVFGGGRLMLTYYESRGFIGADPEAIVTGDITPPSPGFITGIDRVMDVRAALINTDNGTLVGSAQVSRYPIKPGVDPALGPAPLSAVAPVNAPCSPDDGAGLSPCVRRVNRVNAPHTASGTSPFIGDYIDATSVVQFVPTGGGGWKWATDVGDVPYQGFHTVFADNRNQVPPTYPDNVEQFKRYPFYAPPGTGGSCINAGSRNTDVFFAPVRADVVVGAPQTYKQSGIVRAFPVFVSNTMGANRTVTFSLAATSPASFDASDWAVKSVRAQLFAYSGATRVVYLPAASSDAVQVVVRDSTSNDFLGSIWLNADPTNPPVESTTSETHTPGMSTPGMSTPGMSTPGMSTPGMSTPGMSTPGMSTPGMSTPGMSTPGMSTAGIVDVTWDFFNLGNTTSGYLALIDVDNPEQYEGQYAFQLFIYKRAASAGLNGCASSNLFQDQLLVNMPLAAADLNARNTLRTPGMSTPGMSTATFYDAPATSKGGASAQELAAPNGFSDGTTFAPRGGNVRLTLRAYPLVASPTSVFHPEFNPPSGTVVSLSCNTDNTCPAARVGPDLIATVPSLPLPDTRVRVGAALSFAPDGWTLSNQGNRPGAAFDKTIEHVLYLWNGENGEKRVATPLATVITDTPDDHPVAVGANLTYPAINVTIPAGAVPAGGQETRFYLLFAVDANREVSEFNEVNNDTVIPIFVQPPDTTPPVVTVPANMTVEATGAAGATVTYSASAVDAVDGPVAVSCTPASGGTFAIGTTTVSCSATDKAGNTGTATFTITVRDTKPPAVTVIATPTTIWSPNNSLVPVTLTAIVSDWSAVRTVTYRVRDEYGQVQPTGTLTLGPNGSYSVVVSLQASRLGSDKDGRKYTITVTAVDWQGNSASVDTVVVAVNHDSSK